MIKNVMQDMLAMIGLFVGLAINVYGYNIAKHTFAAEYAYVNYLWYVGTIFAVSKAGNLWKDLNVSVESWRNMQEASSAKSKKIIFITPSGIYTEDRLISLTSFILILAFAFYLFGALLYVLFGLSTYYIYYLASGLAITSFGMFAASVNVLSAIVCAIMIKRHFFLK